MFETILIQPLRKYSSKFFEFKQKRMFNVTFCTCDFQCFNAVVVIFVFGLNFCVELYIHILGIMTEFRFTASE